MKAAGILIRNHLSEYLLCGSPKLVFVIIDMSQSTENIPGRVQSSRGSGYSVFRFFVLYIPALLTSPLSTLGP